MSMRYNRTAVAQSVWNRSRSDSIWVQPGEGVDDAVWSVPEFFTNDDIQYSGQDRQVWCVYNTFGDTAFLEASIRSIVQHCDVVLVLWGGNWWGRNVSDDTESVVRPLMQEFRNIRMIRCPQFSDQRADGQLAQRTYGLSLVPTGSWHWLVDSDEVYEADDAAAIEAFLRSPESDAAEAWEIRTLAYYQRTDVVGWTEGFTRIFRSRRNRRFSGVMAVSDGSGTVKNAKIPNVKMHHYSYVKPDDVILAKLQDYERRHRSGVFRAVSSQQCWAEWIRFRQDPHRDQHYVHPIPGYTEERTRVVSQPDVIRRSPWYLGPESGVSIVVVTHNSLAMVLGLLQSIERYGLQEVTTVQWIFVDNASRSDEFRTMESRIRSFDAVVIRNDTNDMFTRAANQGIAASTERNILLLNPDVRVHDGTWLIRMIRQLRGSPNGGVVGCRQVDGTGKIHHAGGFIDGEKFLHIGRGEPDAGQYAAERDVEWVTGSVFLMSRECCCAVGGLDPRYRHYESDNKFCIKARSLGFRVQYSPVTVTHFCGRSCAA